MNRKEKIEKIITKLKAIKQLDMIYYISFSNLRKDLEDTFITILDQAISILVPYSYFDKMAKQPHGVNQMDRLIQLLEKELVNMESKGDNE